MSKMNVRADIDSAIAKWKARQRPAEPVTCDHQWGTAYKSSSGRKMCVKCGYVTSAPFTALGVADRA